VVSAQDVHQVHDSTEYAPRDRQQQDSAPEMATGFTTKELQKMMLQQQQRARQFAKQQQLVRILHTKHELSSLWFHLIS
jgi:hypothetical protein